MQGARYRDLPIIALTANAVSGMKEMFLQNGFNDFLSKPIEISKLNDILEKWIPPEKRREAPETETSS
jgi:CheY-like chemotaxis protein